MDLLGILNIASPFVLAETAAGPVSGYLVLGDGTRYLVISVA